MHIRNSCSLISHIKFVIHAVRLEVRLLYCWCIFCQVKTYSSIVQWKSMHWIQRKLASNHFSHIFPHLHGKILLHDVNLGIDNKSRCILFQYRCTEIHILLFLCLRGRLIGKRFRRMCQESLAKKNVYPKPIRNSIWFHSFYCWQ